MAETARMLDYTLDSYFGSTAPVTEPLYTPDTAPEETPLPEVRERTRTRAESAALSLPSVSPFAILGALVVCALMVLVVHALISYNEVAGEANRLSAQHEELSERARRLEIDFESVIDMKEIERYARDTLGMSKPDSRQEAAIGFSQADSAEVLGGGEGKSAGGGFMNFLASLLAYLK